jgi:monofunctional biosynthetic peptidoglycan transglycosylase
MARLSRRRLVVWAALVIAAVLLWSAVSIAALRFVNPRITAVQLERWVEAIGSDYEMRRTYVPLEHVSRNLRHAVIAAEDGRFYQHHGLDWIELGKVVSEGTEEGRFRRGASTITQQLMKNLFLTTRGSFLRKIAEVPLALLAELLLPKARILELYLNVVEWGPGVFGAEAAARYHYGVSSSALSREQAARLAAILPSPRRWRPGNMDHYSAIILGRMRRMGL